MSEKELDRLFDEVDGLNLNRIQLKKTEIIARQILLYFCDFFRFAVPMFDKANVYRIPIKSYDKFRSKDREKFAQELYRLKRTGFVKKYFDGKEHFIELTEKGCNQMKGYLTADIEIKTPIKWDRKWRLVIYDISNDKKNERDVLRRKLEELGFIKLQESVYVYPFDCLKEISFIKGLYYLSPHVQYVIADRIETEIDLIKKFYDKGVLNDRLLK